MFFVHREDLFTRPESSEDAYVSAFALLASYRLVGGYALLERASFTDVIQVTKVLLKSLLPNVLPTSNEHRRLLTVNAIKSLCSSQPTLALADLKDEIDLRQELGRTGDEKRRTTGTCPTQACWMSLRQQN